jgi:hypothetical protein
VRRRRRADPVARGSRSVAVQARRAGRTRGSRASAAAGCRRRIASPTGAPPRPGPVCPPGRGEGCPSPFGVAIPSRLRSMDRPSLLRHGGGVVCESACVRIACNLVRTNHAICTRNHRVNKNRTTRGAFRKRRRARASRPCERTEEARRVLRAPHGAPLELVPSGRPVRAGDGGAGHLVGTRRRRRNRRPARAAGRGGARRRRGGAGRGREREAPPVPGGTGGARAGAAVRRQRAESGGTGRCSRPVYQESGRISRLSAACSITCAAQPVMREETKIGVKRGMSKPMR